MKLIRVIAIPITLLIAFVSPTPAAETKPPTQLSLQDCINTALKSQTNAIIAQNNVSIAKAGVTRAKSTYFPQLSLQNNAFTLGSKGVLTQQNNGTAFEVTQNIYDGGLRESLTQGARYDVLASQSGLTRTSQTIAYNVTQAYYEALRSKRLADIAEASVKYNEGLREMVQTRVDLGDAAEVDVLPVESQLANARVDLLAAQNAVRTSTIQLQNTMGLSPQQGFDIQDIDRAPSVDIHPMNTYLTTAIASRPDIAQAKAGIGSAKASTKAAKLYLYPRPVIAGQYQAGFAGTRSTSTQVTGGIVFDIFNGGGNKAAYQQAKINQSSAEQQSQQVVMDIEAQVQEAYLNITNAKERLSASEVGLKAAQRNYDVQSEKYKQGLAILLDMLNAQLQVVTSQTNAIQARYDYYIATAQLEYAVGKQGGLNGK